MSITVDRRTVRQSGRALRQAASELKGSLCRARSERTEPNVQDRGKQFEPRSSLFSDVVAGQRATSGRSNGSSAESRLLDLEEQEARLNADRAILKSKEELLERLREVEKKREALRLQSQASSLSLRESETRMKIVKKTTKPAHPDQRG